MPKLLLDGHAYDRDDGETVPDTLLRHDVETSYSCKRGTCFTCLLRAPGAAIPAMAQRGLRGPLCAGGEGRQAHDAANGECKDGASQCLAYARIVAPKNREIGCARLICPSQAQIWACHYRK